MFRITKYFISPEGAVREVPISHIDAVIRDPGSFGTTHADLLAAYERFGERVGLEGFAREAVLTEVLRRGWVRVRYLPRVDCWVFQLAAWDEPAQTRVAAFLGKVYGTLFREVSLRVLDLAGQTLLQTMLTPG